MAKQIVIPGSRRAHSVGAFKDRPADRCIYSLGHGDGVTVDATTLTRMHKYKWHGDKEGRVMATIRTPWTKTMDVRQRPRDPRVRVDLRRFVWDLTTYPKVSTRNNLQFSNSDFGDYTKENLMLQVIPNAPATSSIFPNVMPLYTKDKYGSYGAMCFLPDGRTQLFPAVRCNKFKQMTEERRDLLERAVISLVWEAAKYYDQEVIKMYGLSYSNVNFLSSAGI